VAPVFSGDGFGDVRQQPFLARLSIAPNEMVEQAEAA
jgi:hypothetical protein